MYEKKKVLYKRAQVLLSDVLPTFITKHYDGNL